jgi:hypothetical protein
MNRLLLLISIIFFGIGISHYYTLLTRPNVNNIGAVIFYILAGLIVSIILWKRRSVTG